MTSSIRCTCITVDLNEGELVLNRFYGGWSCLNCVCLWEVGTLFFSLEVFNV